MISQFEAVHTGKKNSGGISTFYDKIYLKEKEAENLSASISLIAELFFSSLISFTFRKIIILTLHFCCSYTSTAIIIDTPQ